MKIPVKNYRQLEYIHFSGSEYVKISNWTYTTTRWELTYKMDSATGSNQSNGSSGSNDIAILGADGSGNVRTNFAYDGGYAKVYSDYSALNKVTVVMDRYNGRTFINGNLVYTGTAQTGSTNNKGLGFGAYLDANSEPAGYMTGNVYGSKLYQSNIFETELVPCQRKSDGVCGLYDLGANSFKAMQGTNITTAAAGPTVKEFIEIEVAEITVPTQAPEGYTRLDYIENTSTAHIDTGVYVNPNTAVDITYRWTDLTVQQRLFGDGDGSSNSNFVIESYINGAGNMAYAYNDDNGNWVNTGVTAVSNADVSIRVDGYNKRYYLRNLNTNLKVKAMSLQGTATKTATTTLWLFDGNRNNGQTPNRPGLFKCYGCSISDSGVLIRDYIPVKRNSDNKAGLYDLVNNQFYLDPNNTDFVAGNVITKSNVNIIKDSTSDIIWASDGAFPYRRLEYIHFNGAEYIQTPVQVKSDYYRYYQFDLERKDVRQMTLASYDATATATLSRYYVLDFQPNSSGCRACCGNTWSTTVSLDNIPLNTKMRCSVVNSTVSSKPRMLFNLKNLVSNTNIISNTTINGTANGTLSSLSAYLMATHTKKTDGTEVVENPATGKVYYFEERETNYQGNRTHEQFPAQRKVDGKCGLYDVITGQFYEMNGIITNEGAAGPVADEYWDLAEPTGWLPT